jgi:hypothetical protein
MIQSDEYGKGVQSAMHRTIGAHCGHDESLGSNTTTEIVK